MPLALLDLSVSLTWQFQLELQDFRPIKQGRESRNWDLSGLDLTLYDQAIIGEIILSSTTPDLEIDLTDQVNLVVEGVNLETVQTILVKVLPLVDGEENFQVQLEPGDTNGFPWLWRNSDGPGEIIMPNGVYLNSCGVAAAGTNPPGIAVTPTAKILKLSNPGPHGAAVFLFIGGKNSS